MAAGGRISRQPAHGADLRGAFAMESRSVGCAFVFAQHAGAGRPRVERRNGCVRFRLVRFWTRAGFRAVGKRVSRYGYAFTTLEGFVGTREASRRLGRGAAMDDSQGAESRLAVHGQWEQSSAGPAAFRRLCVCTDSRHQRSQSRSAEANGSGKFETFDGQSRHSREQNGARRLDIRINRANTEAL